MSDEALGGFKGALDLLSQRIGAPNISHKKTEKAPFLKSSRTQQLYSFQEPDLVQNS